MKKRKLYYFEDIFNLVLFYSIFITIAVVSILSIIELLNGVGKWQSIAYNILMLFAMTMPYIIKKLLKIKISRIITCAFYLIIFLSAFVGRRLNVFSSWPEYDTLLHFLSGIFLSALGITSFLLLNNNNHKNKALMYVFMICFTMFVGSCWEIMRYVINIVFNSAVTDGYGLLDTIIDLSADLLGGVVGIIITHFAIKISPKYPLSLSITKLKHSEVEVEEIEE